MYGVHGNGVAALCPSALQVLGTKLYQLLSAKHVLVDVLICRPVSLDILQR